MKHLLKNKKIIFFGLFALSFFFVTPAEAVNLNDSIVFNVDSSYDATARFNLEATLIKTTSKLYFYIEKSWWDSQIYAKQNEILNNLEILSQEFENKIYPVLTSVFGSEWNPGIDSDSKITILFHLMKGEAGGYFRTNDEYLKLQVPDSNEREMVYLPINQLDNSYKLKVILAHELVHLITFNQKDKMFGLSEETWLNEARAEYSATILGYNDNYTGSVLRERMRDFLENPSDSLTEWRENKYDYAVINAFTHYVVDHYGVQILIDSLKTKSVGIPSINEALKKNGIKKDFSQIFTDWTVAVVVNNCSFGNEYCYLNPDLSSVRIVPNLNFLPFGGQSSLFVANITKNWAGNWQKIFGGSGNLKLEFSSLKGLNFKVPYLIQTKSGETSLNFLSLDENQKGEISLSDFGAQNMTLIIIPSLQTKLSGFDGNELTYPYSFTISVSGQQRGNPLIPVGFAFNKNLYYGIKSEDVIYLKIILAAEECVSNLANTNYFGPATLRGVKCFQNKYKSEISAAAGYAIRSTGFVGIGTRMKLNSLLGLTGE